MDIHPLIVHFPIALLIVGALCDAVGILGRRDGALRMGYLLLILGVAGAVAAALSGEAAAGSAGRIPGIGGDLERHETLATAAVWAGLALVLGRTHLVLKGRFAGGVRTLYLLLALGVAGLVAASGYTGGRLVYEYGAGTAPVRRALERHSE